MVEYKLFQLYAPIDLGDNGDTVISYGGNCNQAGGKLDNSLPFYTLHTHPRLLA